MADRVPAHFLARAKGNLVAPWRLRRPLTDREAEALQAELDEAKRLREELRIREESQIPVIPRAAHERLQRYETALARIVHFPFDVNETTADDLRAVKRLAERALDDGGAYFCDCKECADHA